MHTDKRLARAAFAALCITLFVSPLTRPLRGADAPDRVAVTCPGTYGGHLQGVAIDSNENFYWSFTVAIVKTDAQGRLLSKVDAPTHQGDLTVHDGKVYVAVNLARFNEEAGSADSWVYVYDANDLTLLSKHAVPELVHGAGGMAYHDGRFIIIGGLPADRRENYVYEYDERFRFIERHELPTGYTTLGIQTAAFHAGHWWFGCYGDKVIKAAPDFELIDVFDFDAGLGIVGAVKTSRRGQFWIGRGFERWRGRVLPAEITDDGRLRLTAD